MLEHGLSIDDAEVFWLRLLTCTVAPIVGFALGLADLMHSGYVVPASLASVWWLHNF